MFKFLDVQMLMNRVRSSASILLPHEAALSHKAIARYNVTRVELKTFTFSGGSQSLSIDNAVLGLLPKRLLFTMIRTRISLARWPQTPITYATMTSTILPCM